MIFLGIATCKAQCDKHTKARKGLAVNRGVGTCPRSVPADNAVTDELSREMLRPPAPQDSEPRAVPPRLQEEVGLGWPLKRVEVSLGEKHIPGQDGPRGHVPASHLRRTIREGSRAAWRG